MENSAKTCHLLTSLPEIIHKIMEFLSNSDLESASMVNPAWEGAALKHLLVRNPVDINLRNVTDPSDVLLPLINLSPSNVRIFSHEESNNVVNLVDLFNLAKFKTVTKLYLYFPVDNNFRHVACNLIKILENESFKNLKSLQLHPGMANYEPAFSSKLKWKDIFPENMSYPGKNLPRTNLTLDMGSLYIPFFTVQKFSKIVSLTTRVLAVFRQVANLKMSAMPGGIFEQSGISLPNLRALSLKKYWGLEHQDGRNEEIKKFYKFNLQLNSTFENVTRYEFNVPSNDYCINQFELFRFLAPQLEQVCISSVKSCAPQELIPHVVPILPRL
ncbi:uncharacterized protein LOC118439165 [Folsomia candida]|uniref:uncharacterized protein LOC118439165 n=1 Tax=Folsomia candida TaxID=158441 RepID=UPI001604A270|nr:uncharacterized protein LOC118439165 [Folsomia candida]